jgi:hypothetical protein
MIPAAAKIHQIRSPYTANPGPSHLNDRQLQPSAVDSRPAGGRFRIGGAPGMHSRRGPLQPTPQVFQVRRLVRPGKANTLRLVAPRDIVY